MQKKIIALAVAGLVAAPAFAQSNVQITGLASISYNNISFGDKVAGSVKTNENRLDDNTSRFTIKGTEDLGGGLSAYFQFENRVSLDTRPNSTYGNTQGLGDGESFVGLKSNKLGSIGFGKFAMHYHEGMGYSETYRALQTQMYASAGILGQMNGTYVAGSTRQQNTVKYETPNWNGFQGKIAYSFSAFGSEGQANNAGLFGACTTQFGGCAVNLAASEPFPGTAAAGLFSKYTPSNAALAATNSDYNKGGAWNIVGRYYNGPINAVISYYNMKPEWKNATATTNFYAVNTWTPAGSTITSMGNAGAQKGLKAHFDYKFPFGLQVGLGYDQFKADLGSGIVTTYAGLGGAGAVVGVPVTYNLGVNKRTAWMIPVSYQFGAHKVYFTYAKAGDVKNSVTGTANATGAKQYTLAYDYALSKRTYVGASYVRLDNDRNATYNPWLSGISTLGGSTLAAGEDARYFSLNMTHFF